MCKTEATVNNHKTNMEMMKGEVCSSCKRFNWIRASVGCVLAASKPTDHNAYYQIIVEMTTHLRGNR